MAASAPFFGSSRATSTTKPSRPTFIRPTGSTRYPRVVTTWLWSAEARPGWSLPRVRPASAPASRWSKKP